MQPITNPTLTASICTLEHSLWSALCTSGAALLPLLSATPVLIFPGDRIITATSSPSVQEVLQDPGFAPWTEYALSHDEVLPIGDSGALVYYRVQAVREGQKFGAICSSVWAREGGDWKVVSHQQTLV